MGDDRMPESGRVTLRPSEQLLCDVLTVGYPIDEYPEIDSAPRAFERAGAEIARHRRHGGTPPEIQQSLCDDADKQGGLLPLVLSQDGDALIEPTDDGGVRIDTTSDEADGFPGDGIERMEFEELSDEDLRRHMQALDPADIAETALRLCALRDDLDVESLLALIWYRSDADLADVFEYSLRDGYVSSERLQAAAAEASDRVADD